MRHQVAKLRIGANADGFVPAGQYFKRLAEGLREANARETRAQASAISRRTAPRRERDLVDLPLETQH